MRPLLLFIFAFTLVRCESNPVVEENPKELTPDTLKQPNIAEDFKSPFPKYIFHPKDTILKTDSLGIKKQIISIGTYTTDTMHFNAISEFKLIPGIFADSPKGRSTLFLINEKEDTMVFDAEMPDQLPIDIYKNHFVFKDENGNFLFSTIEFLEGYTICFSGTFNICFV